MTFTELFSGAEHYTKNFRSHPIQSSHQNCEVGIIIFILQMKKGSLLALLAQSHSAIKEQNCNVKPGVPNSVFFLLISNPLVEIVGKNINADRWASRERLLPSDLYEAIPCERHLSTHYGM